MSLTSFHHAKAEGEKEARQKRRLVNKLGLFLTACVNASRIEREGSIFFFFLPPLLSQLEVEVESRTKVVLRRRSTSIGISLTNR